MLIKNIHRSVDLNSHFLPRLPKEAPTFAILLLDLLDLLASLLSPLVPVFNCEVECVMRNLQLGADARLECLDEPLGSLRLLVFILICADDVDDGREGELLELVGVFLDNGNALLQLRKRRVAQLVGTGQVWRDVGVGCLEVGVEWRDEGVVRVVEQREGLGTVGVRLVELD